MNVTIIGAGNMGRGIATRLLAGGNNITLIDHDPEAAARLAEELRPAIKGNATVTAGQTIDGSVVILAIYFPSIPDAVRLYGDQLGGKIVVDISNPLNQAYDDLATTPGTSSAEETANMVPASAKVLKAFNTTFAGTLVAGQVAGQPLDVFIAGDDAQAKATFSDLVRSGGLRPIDVGPLRRARQLEGIGLLHITLQSTLGTNWMSAVKVLP